MKLYFYILANLIMFSPTIFSQHEQINSLFQTWAFSGNQSDTLIYKASNKNTEAHLYTFSEKGSVEVKQNAGWCGTPPISYSDYTGKWEKTGNNTFNLTYPFWGGIVYETWKIISCNSSELKIHQLYLKHERE